MFAIDILSIAFKCCRVSEEIVTGSKYNVTQNWEEDDIVLNLR